MSSISKARRQLYRSANVLGDVTAVSKGPAAIVRRVVRKAAWRGWSRAIRRTGL